ncbi:MAG: hypothetical protein F4126_12990 [Acidimicrobiaceae bacterium]|nr:hypothetical protein [Acidimicrobiaceae bacterium]MXZ52145.1 hypothetical protein [Acidimicrobiaceae bacterium]MYB87274.1 hypothetical protein [Acidimicrobiaceae bacterium]MYH94614.1 hypothetical protein [Acidimicrobiaceae bacterium]
MTLDSNSEHRGLTRIHLRWEGPHTFEGVWKMNEPSDYGLYQVYGPHPTGATESLLYIGQANGQTFGERFTNADRQEWCSDGWGDNTVLLRFFTGRVLQTKDEQQCGAIDDELWGTYIDLAERLLIFAHSPHWNSQGIYELPREQTDDYDNCHILNWGTRASLLPEVSGARYTETVFEQLCDDPLDTRQADGAGPHRGSVRR